VDDLAAWGGEYLSWRCRTARQTCTNQLRTCSSLKGVPACRAVRIRWARSPPYAYSITMFSRPLAVR
jgi:hypothetical protein